MSSKMDGTTFARLGLLAFRGGTAASRSLHCSSSFAQVLVFLIFFLLVSGQSLSWIIGQPFQHSHSVRQQPQALKDATWLGGCSGLPCQHAPCLPPRLISPAGQEAALEHSYSQPSKGRGKTPSLTKTQLRPAHFLLRVIPPEEGHLVAAGPACGWDRPLR